jgi:uncharacterized membrane protein
MVRLSRLAFAGRMTSLRSAVLFAATLTTGLAAGLFASWAYSVMPGLARADDRTFVTAVQRMNVAILNGWFAVCFGGALVFGVAAALLHLGGPDRRALPWIVAGALLYIAVVVVTFAANVPLNDRLAAAGDPARIRDLAAVRAAFEAGWIRWNVVRAVLNTAAFGCLTWAMLLSGRMTG